MLRFTVREYYGGIEREVLAVQMPGGYVVSGRVMPPGSWIVLAEDDGRLFLTDDDFHAAYDPWLRGA